MQAVDEQAYGCAGLVAADADVVQASVDAQGDGSGLVDAVGADAVVGVDAGGGVGFGSAGVDGGPGWGSERCGRRWLYSSIEGVDLGL